VLWKMGPLRGEGRAGARLWLREATRRDRGGIGPGSKPGAAGDTPGQSQATARPPAGGYLIPKKVSALESSRGPVGPIESVFRDVPICRGRGTADGSSSAGATGARRKKAAAKRCRSRSRSGTGFWIA
jgi:hypothetical protein